MNRRWWFAAALVAIAALAAGLAFGLRSSAQPASAGVGRLSLPIPRGFNSYEIPGNLGPGSPLTGQAVTNFRPPADATIDDVLRRWREAQWKYAAVKNH